MLCDVKEKPKGFKVTKKTPVKTSRFSLKGLAFCSLETLRRWGEKGLGVKGNGRARRLEA